jgi:hypothetical protein
LIAKAGTPLENLWFLLKGHRREKLQTISTTYNRSHYSKAGKKNYEEMAKSTGQLGVTCLEDKFSATAAAGFQINEGSK